MYRSIKGDIATALFLGLADTSAEVWRLLEVAPDSDALSRSHAGAARGQGFRCWLNGMLHANALGPAFEGALREWPIWRRINKVEVGDDDPTIIEKTAA
jgi:hypothetical protein